LLYQLTLEAQKRSRKRGPAIPRREIHSSTRHFCRAVVSPPRSDELPQNPSTKYWRCSRVPQLRCRPGGFGRKLPDVSLNAKHAIDDLAGSIGLSDTAEGVRFCAPLQYPAFIRRGERPLPLFSLRYDCSGPQESSRHPGGTSVPFRDTIRTRLATEVILGGFCSCDQEFK